MCVMSMVMEHYGDKWWKGTGTPPQPLQPFILPAITRDEFDALKKDMLEMKELLKRAKIYDEKTGQPDCESEDKIKKLRALAEIVGLDLDDLLGKKSVGSQGGEETP